ncbi:MAG: hypothetical protein QOE74_4732 [Mycobacterium sp.]|jgi:hypothetical protein|nr:hypothetical protein [Mycobacterium sp.]
MAGHDPSRFDYLFEPIDGDLESVGDGDAQVAIEASRRWPSLAVVAAVVLGAGLGMVVLWPRPADAVGTPTGLTTTTKPVPAPRASSIVGSPSPVPSFDPATTVAPMPVVPSAEPPLQPQPTTSPAPEPRRMPAASPSVRAPMSVSPQPRPAFPNQHPGAGSDGRGGLLGLGGLL